MYFFLFTSDVLPDFLGLPQAPPAGHVYSYAALSSLHSLFLQQEHK